MINQDLKDLIKEKGIYFYEVAFELGISESYLRMLLHQRLKPERREKILNAINEIARRKAEACEDPETINRE